MRHLNLSKTTRKIQRVIVAVCLSPTILLLASCQTIKPDSDSRKMHDGVLGLKANVEASKNICKKPVEINRKRYGRLSSRNRRRSLQDYVIRIRKNVYAEWIKPSDVSLEESCTALIKQRIDGCVRNVSFKSCRHFKLRTTVRQAIYKASPLPIAPHPSLFTDQILLNFRMR